MENGKSKGHWNYTVAYKVIVEMPDLSAGELPV